MLDDELREAVGSGMSLAKIRELAGKKGFRTLWELGLDAVRQGRTSPEELLRVVSAGEFGPAGER